jgi:cysteinyl-tRNA synthetase
MLRVYNTLSKSKEPFTPINKEEVKMYVCGPTVYDYFHIGNARSFISSDFIRRYLEYKGFKVKFLMNLTDIDDKIIRKSASENKTHKQVAEQYSSAFFEDIEKLKIKPATLYPKATEHIDEIIMLIETLINKGAAYNINGNVFYDVSKFHKYGMLSGKNIEELESGSRVEVMEEKKNPLDFALWKKAKEGEPWWKSPWGNGRPGWHIECSAMSCKHLGKSFDIHAGGSDLIFPHHENEIAQSEAANEQQFVKYWLHFGFLNINEEKMSKSLGNFFTAREILKIYPAEAIRMFFAQTHYSGPLNFSEELIQASQKGLEKINNLVDKINDELKKSPASSSPFGMQLNKHYAAFEEAMDDDFNTPQALAAIFDFVKEANRTIAENEAVGSEFYLKLKEFIEKTAGGVLGIIDFNRKISSSNLEDDLVELIIKLRLDAKKEKNFALADKIRDELKILGIELKDSKEKTIFKKSI